MYETVRSQTAVLQNLRSQTAVLQNLLKDPDRQRIKPQNPTAVVQTLLLLRGSTHRRLGSCTIPRDWNDPSGRDWNYRRDCNPRD